MLSTCRGFAAGDSMADAAVGIDIAVQLTLLCVITSLHTTYISTYCQYVLAFAIIP